MTRWTCSDCSTTFQVGLVDMCPRCTGTNVGQGAPPHALRGGVILPGYAPPVTGDVVLGQVVDSDTAGTGDAVNADTGEVTPAGQPLPVIEQLDPEEKPWPGSSSSTSDEKPPPTASPAKGSRRKRAPGAGSRSTKGQAASSSARSTATSGPATDD